VPALCEAAKLEDKDQRERALLRAFEEALESADAQVREAAFRHLSSLWYGRWPALDPRPLAPALVRFDELEGDDEARCLLDRAALYFAPRPDRLDVYRRAIVEGSAPAGEHYVVSRETAMESAAREGLLELRELVERYYGQTDQGSRQSLEFGLDYLLVSIDLRGGGVDRKDTDARAARRLTEVPPEQLWARMSSSPLSWGVVVREIYGENCGTPEGHGCNSLRDHLLRLRPFLDELRSKRLASWDREKGKQPPEEGATERALGTFLAFVAAGVSDQQPVQTQAASQP
jgi:hypothetical protein